MFAWLFSRRSRRASHTRAQLEQANQLRRQIRQARRLVRTQIAADSKSGKRETVLWHNSLKPPEVLEAVLEELQAQDYEVEVQQLPSVSIMGTCVHCPELTIRW